MGSRQTEPRRAPETNSSSIADRVGNTTLQRQSDTNTTKPTPDSDHLGTTASQVDQQYDVDISSRRQLHELQRLKQTHGDKVHDWLDEGMPREVMGSPRAMEAFRMRKDTPVPWNAETQNKHSVQRNTNAAADTARAGETGVPDSVRDVISASGHSLERSTQRTMEAEMGDSFDDVQVHTGAKAATACEDINARAFTVGNHIAFNAGEYDPSSPAGQHVIAHELAHVRQQTGGAVSMLPQDGLDLGVDPDSQFEREAEATAHRVMQGGEVGIQRLENTPVHIQRFDQGDPKMPDVPVDLPLVAEGRRRLMSGYDITEQTESGTQQITVPGARLQIGGSCHFGALQAALTATGRNARPLFNFIRNFPQSGTLPKPLRECLDNPNCTVEDMLQHEQDPDVRQYIRQLLNQKFRKEVTEDRYRISNRHWKYQSKNPNARPEYRFVAWANSKSQFLQKEAMKNARIHRAFDPTRFSQAKEISLTLANIYKNKKRENNDHPLSETQLTTDDDLRAGETLLKKDIRQGQSVGPRTAMRHSNDMNYLKQEFMKIASTIPKPFYLNVGSRPTDTDPNKIQRRTVRHALLVANIRRENGDILLDIRDSNDPVGKTKPTPINKFLSLIHSDTISRDIGTPDLDKDYIEVSPIDLDSATIDGLSKPVDLSKFQSESEMDESVHPSILAASAVSVFDRSQQDLRKAAESITQIRHKLTQFRTMSSVEQLRTKPREKALESRLTQAETQHQHAEDGRKTARQIAQQAAHRARELVTYYTKLTQIHSGKSTELEGAIADLTRQHKQLKEEFAQPEDHASTLADGEQALFGNVNDETVSPDAPNLKTTVWQHETEQFAKQHDDLSKQHNQRKAFLTNLNNVAPKAQQRLQQAEQLVAQLNQS